MTPESKKLAGRVDAPVPSRAGVRIAPLPYSGMTHAGRYQTAYDDAIGDPDGFWARAAESLRWTTPYERVLDATRAPF